MGSKAAVRPRLAASGNFGGPCGRVPETDAHRKRDIDVRQICTKYFSKFLITQPHISVHYPINPPAMVVFGWARGSFSTLRLTAMRHNVQLLEARRHRPTRRRKNTTQEQSVLPSGGPAPPLPFHHELAPLGR